MSSLDADNQEKNYKKFIQFLPLQCLPIAYLMADQ